MELLLLLVAAIIALPFRLAEESEQQQEPHEGAPTDTILSTMTMSDWMGSDEYHDWLESLR